MKADLKILCADPAGNKTLLIEGNVPAKSYASLASRLLQTPGLEAEQAGFVCLPKNGGAGRLEMSGGEFCGNASRAFGYYLGEKFGIRKGCIPIEISGSSSLVPVTFDQTKGEAYAKMPLPEEIDSIELPAPFGTQTIVRFSGIWHIILPEVPEDRRTFECIRESVYKRYQPEALGVMFLNEEQGSMVPIVYVRGPGTVYEESSCGSGTTAVAAWIAQKDPSRTEISLLQPGGILHVKIGRQNGEVTLSMGGSVSIEKEIQMSIEL